MSVIFLILLADSDAVEIVPIDPSYSHHFRHHSRQTNELQAAKECLFIEM